MLGTAINVGTILVGSTLGISIGSRLPDRIRQTVMQGLGLLTLLVGMQMALGTQNIMVILGAVLTGGIVGEILHINQGLEKLASLLQSLLSRHPDSLFGEGFVTGSLVFCIGPMAILGSIQDGITGDYRLLAIKSTLDGFAAIAFAASLGWGVAFSALSILLYQGTITLFATTLSGMLSDAMITEMTSAGGLLVVAIGVKLLDLKDIRLASFLPALFFAPVIVALLPLFRSAF